MPRQRLSSEQIVNAGVSYADQHGVDLLSMRKLADSLGSGVMSLYNHVADKNDLLAGMVDLVVADIELPPTEIEWKGAVRSSAQSARRVLMAHPWAAGQWTLRMPGPHRIAYMESILSTLDAGGLSDDLVYHGYHAVTMHIVGFTIQELGYELDRASLANAAEDMFANFSTDEYPHLGRHIHSHTEGPHVDDFGIVLDFILDGMAPI